MLTVDVVVVVLVALTRTAGIVMMVSLTTGARMQYVDYALGDVAFIRQRVLHARCVCTWQVI